MDERWPGQEIYFLTESKRAVTLKAVKLSTMNQERRAIMKQRTFTIPYFTTENRERMARLMVLEPVSVDLI